MEHAVEWEVELCRQEQLRGKEEMLLKADARSEGKEPRKHTGPLSREKTGRAAARSVPPTPMQATCIGTTWAKQGYPRTALCS